jgi:hypothetical protein
MAIISSGLVDIQAWGSNGNARGPLPKWWRWVMLLILVYSSTISVLTGQARWAWVTEGGRGESGDERSLPAGRRGGLRLRRLLPRERAPNPSLSRNRTALGAHRLLPRHQERRALVRAPRAWRRAPWSLRGGRSRGAARSA